MRTFGLLLAAALLIASACTREDGSAAQRPAPPTAAAAAAPAPTPPPPPPPPRSDEELQAELPGFPLAEVPTYQREALVAAAKDEFVYDGSPYTLAGCVKEKRPCKEAATRGLTLIASELAAGATKAEALRAYNRYYASFAAQRRVAPSLEDVPCKGPANAKVTLVEFSDFECPHCNAARPLLEKLVESRTDVRLCFKHFPLPSHTNAMSAAQAAVFAHRHGKFWQVHDLLFANQRTLSPSRIKELVQQAGLDPAALVASLQKSEVTGVVENQREEGRRFGVQGTPAIFVNGRQYELGLSEEQLLFTIEDELAYAANGGKWTAP